MAKITRRTVRSSLSSSSSSLPTSSSFSSVKSTSNTSRSTTETIKSSSTLTKASKLTTDTPSATLKQTTTNVYDIINGVKSAHSIATDMSYKLAMPLIAFNDAPSPLRNTNGNTNNKQFVANGNGALPATNTTSGGTYVFAGTNGRRTGSGHYNKTAAERKFEQEEFYATYDVMTGVRIAATLSGFFGLMVFLIVWKSRSSSNETLKVLKDPKMAAVAAVCMQEEEEREIQEAMVATGMSIYPDEYDAIIYRRQRMLSLGNVSAPPMLNRGYRFSSVGGGGYSSLLEPPRRFSYSATSGVGSFTGGRRKSGSESSRILCNYPMGSSFGNDDYFIETEDELECTDYPRSGERQSDELPIMPKRTDSTKSKGGLLSVPPAGQDSRRSSAMTCCSTESSYLERRCSAFTLGLSNLPPTLQRKLSSTSHSSSPDNWDYYYPDIHVIQPTPKPSPCPSERSLYEQLQTYANGASTTANPKVSTALQPLPAKTTMVATITTHTKAGTTNTVLSAADTNLPNAQTEASKFVRKHSIAYYDPHSAQAGRKQEIHSISADTIDIYPYNQTLFESSGLIGFSDGAGSAAGSVLKSSTQAEPNINTRYGFHYCDSPSEDSRGGSSLYGKVAIIELQHLNRGNEQIIPPPPPPLQEHNNNSFPYTSSAAVQATVTAATANSSSISMDSTAFSLDKLNGSGSLGTISAKALFNVEKRAPLASLSSFKISSLEYQDSEEVDDDSVFVDSVADTDEDMQQLSSDSEEISFGEHDPLSMNENVALVTAHSSSSGDPAGACVGGATTNVPLSLRPESQPLRYPIEKRYSLGAASNDSVIGATKLSRGRRPLLQRHSTVNVSSSDRVALLGHQLKEFHHSNTGSGSPTPTTITETMPLETHFGSIICTSSSPTHPRRAQLLQQYSDPHSLPTTTTTTATTEEFTCSTLNTELFGGTAGGHGFSGSTGDGCSSGGGGGGAGIFSEGGEGCGSATLTQNSSLNTVISFGRSSDVSAPATVGATGNERFSTDALKASKNQTRTTQQQQLPCSSLYDDPCASSVSDSMIIRTTTRQPIICMPASLKNLILRGSANATTNAITTNTTNIPTADIYASKSATNLSLRDDSNILGGSAEATCRSVMLELPLIKLPTDESSESSSASEGVECTHNKSEESRDQSNLASSNRKWSKETLF